MRGSLRRFLSIAAICLLGVTMLVGLTIACEDLRLSADEFFDAQRLYDVSVQSTLGLTDDDVVALAALDGVEAAEGSWDETAYTQVGGARHSVAVHALTAQGMNEPYLIEGRLPESANEVAVTSEYLEESGKQLGDILTFSADDADSELFEQRDYTIVAAVIDPTSVAAKNGSSSFRATGAKYAFFVPAAAVTSDVYSVVYLRVSGAAQLNGFSGAYQERVSEVVAKAEAIKGEREAAREQEVRADAEAQVDEAEADANARLATGEQQLADAQATIDDALAQIADGRAQLARQGASAREQLDAAQRKIGAGKLQLELARSRLEANETQVADGEAQLVDGRAQLDAAQATLDAQREAAERGIADYDAGMYEVTSGASQLRAALGASWPEAEWQAVLDAADKESSAAAQEAFVSRIKDYADVTLPLLDTGLTLTDETLSPLDRLIAGEEELRQDVAARANELVTNLEQSGLLTESQLAQVRDARQKLDDPMADTAKLTEARDQLAAVREILASQRGQLAALPDSARQLAEGAGKLALSRAQVDAARDALAGAIPEAQATIDARRAELETGAAQLADGRAQLSQGWASYRSGLSELEAGQAELDGRRASATEQLADAAAQLDDAEAQAANGQAELDARREEFERQKAEALAKIADARAKIADIGQATWYVQDRSAISSYASIDSDASCIQVIGTVFPAIFLTVAILVSLTTATRMVEEERGLIGLYKALGYRRARIMSKYVTYTLSAAALGGAIGSVLGFIALPEFLFGVFEVMYNLPQMTLHFDASLCALAVGMFVVGIGAATALTVRGELAEQPAALMRPKAPSAGTRILLERIGPAWRRLSFLNKVTARNLFRYKRRLAMTVFGVAGCTALMICGFAIADTVLALSPNQYGDASRAGIYEYDLLAVTQPQDLEGAAAQLTAAGEVEGYVPARTENVTLDHNGAKETVQLVVVPDGFSLDGYIDLRTESGGHLSLEEATAGPDGVAGTEDDGVLATKNASTVLGFGTGDELTVQDTALRQANARVDAVVMNYLGNAVYLTQSTYERLFGVPLETNAMLAHLSGDADAQIAFANQLASDPTYLSVTSIQEGIRDFTANFMLINYVVVLITTLAAGLSFVVLFTLSTTNISERKRELATIKVLGFRRGEVRTYVNKELLILAAMGTACGIPVGTVLGHALTYVLNMPSMYFAVEIHPLSYVWSCGMSMLFAVVVCLITNRSLDRVDMVGALKSAE